MRFWMLALLGSGPVRLGSIAVRVLAWLLISSGLVLWWGPGDSSSRPGQALVSVALGGVLWVAATVPRWLASAVTLRDR